MSDIIDVLAEIHPGSALDRVRAARPQAKENAQRSFEVLFEPEDTGDFSLAERYAVAAYTVGLHSGGSPAAAFYLELAAEELDDEVADILAQLVARDKVQGPYGDYREPGLRGQSLPGPSVSHLAEKVPGISEKLAAALTHSHMLTFHPRDARPRHLQQLEQAGWSPDAIVTLSQIISFLAFQSRVIEGLRALGRSPGPGHTGSDTTRPDWGRDSEKGEHR